MGSRSFEALGKVTLMNSADMGAPLIIDGVEIRPQIKAKEDRSFYFYSNYRKYP
ncbi:hypothetical protein RHECNPAF_12210098 [Rhizobium etli CNPAF512]|nr:hypothetical protein RHECNPAF_12210098 [Rhizobium etli CNPAF512]